MDYVEKPTRKSFVDLEGNKYGLLKILGYMGCDDKHSHLWHVQCDCGNVTVLKGDGIRKGLTKSCGCLRKNNGGREHMTQEEAEKLCPNVKFIEYKGMKQPAKFECIFCNKQGETVLANSLRAYTCDCQAGGAEKKRIELFKEKGYTLLESTGWTSREHKIQCDSCGTVSYHKGAALGCIEECKCRSDVTSENPGAIYCLYNEYDNYIKVGKSITPVRRLGEINSARELQGEKPLQIYKTVWVVSESAAYYLESLYHTIHKDNRLYLEDWTGSTETFSLGVDSFDEFIKSHQSLISKLKTEEPPDRPKYVLKFKPYYDSYEIAGVWYPYAKSVVRTLNVTRPSLDRYIAGVVTLQELMDSAIPQYNFNGITSKSLTGLCCKLRISPTVVSRFITSGLSVDAAISSALESHPTERIRTVTVNGVRMPLKSMWEKYGLKSKTANNLFRNRNYDVYKVLSYYNITTTDEIVLIRHNWINSK